MGFREDRISEGFRVIVGHELGKYVVVVHRDGDTVGLDAQGEPLERKDGEGGPNDPVTVTYIHPDAEVDIYASDSVEEIKQALIKDVDKIDVKIDIKEEPK